MVLFTLENGAITRHHNTRGGVEDTRLEAKAKDTKKIRGQGQGQPLRGQTLLRSRTGMLEAKATDQGHKAQVLSKKKSRPFYNLLSNLFFWTNLFICVIYIRFASKQFTSDSHQNTSDRKSKTSYVMSHQRWGKFKFTAAFIRVTEWSTE